jgi:hypothetical protein
MNVSVLTAEVTLCPMRFEQGSCKDATEDHGVLPETITVFRWKYTRISVGKPGTRLRSEVL